MTPTKILFGQLTISGFLAFVMIWVATQWTADQFGYSSQLGAPWFYFNQSPFYRPFDLFFWWLSFESAAPIVFLKAGVIAASGGLMGIAAAIAGSVLRARQPRQVTTYGSADWASDRDIRQSGLLGSSGVILGKWQNHYLRHEGQEHVLAFAPTRSGKGVGLVIPTLLSWTGSTIVHDIKGENWDVTAGWRSKFSRCLRFDPADPVSAKFNPLLEIRKGIHELQDTQNIVDMLIDPQGSKEDRNHWDKTAADLLTASILHVLYAESDKTLRGVAKFLSDPSRTAEEMLEVMRISVHSGGRPHLVIAQAARQAQNMSPNEFSGVLSTALSCLSLYRDPIIGEVTSESDFRIADLISTEHPVSLYLVVSPADLSRTRPLIRLMVNQMLRRLTECHAAEQSHHLLLMLDEFPALGRLDFFEAALSFIGGYGIKAFLVAQSLTQIEKAYGSQNAIVDNCHIRITFAANNEQTAKRISDALGTTTEQRHQRNFAGHRLAPWLSHMMVSSQETQRHLLTPGEIMQLPADDAVILLGGQKPIRAKKLKFFDDRNFIGRQFPPPVTAVSLGNRQAKRSDWVTAKSHTAPKQRQPELELIPQEPCHPSQSSEAVQQHEPEDDERNVERFRFLSRVDEELLPDLGGSLD